MDAAPSAPAPPIRRPNSASFGYFLLLALFFFFMSGGPAPADSNARLILQGNLERRKQELNGLRNWTHQTYGSVNDSVAVLQSVAALGRGFGQGGQELVQTWLHQRTTPDDGVYLRNLTGFAKGTWQWKPESTTLYPPLFLSNQTDDQTSASNALPQPSVDITTQAQLLTKSNLTELDSQSAAIDLTTLTNTNPKAFEAQRGWFGWTPSIEQINQTVPLGRSADTRNWTTGIGKASISFHEGYREDIRFDASLIRGTMSLETKDGREVSLDVEGIHFLDNGTFFLHAWPADVYLDTRTALTLSLDYHNNDHQSNLQPFNSSLPADWPTSQQNITAHVVIADLERRVSRIRQMLMSGDIPDDSSNSTLTVGGESDDTNQQAQPNCWFKLYGQLRPLPKWYTNSMLEEYESSLVNPTGASASIPAKPTWDGIMLSEECGLVIEVSNAETLLTAVLWSKGERYAWITGWVMAIQTWLLVKQMDARQSPSALSRISYTSVVMQVGMDAYVFSAHLTLAVVTENVSSVPLMIPAFFACISAVLFGMRYGALVRVHTPLPSTNPTTTTTAAATTMTATTTATTNVQGQQRTAPALPLINVVGIPSDIIHVSTLQDQPWFLIAGFVLLISCVVMIIVFGWSVFIMLVLFSYWIPQIIHNVQRRTGRRGLKKRYIIGVTLCRLYLPLYVWACPRNVLFMEPSRWIYALVFYSISQALILIGQDMLDPRFIIFHPFLITLFQLNLEPIWNYHPIMTLEDLMKLQLTGHRAQGGVAEELKEEEGDVNIDVEGNDESPGHPDCMICFEPIELFTSTTSSNSNTNAMSMTQKNNVNKRNIHEITSAAGDGIDGHDRDHESVYITIHEPQALARNQADKEGEEGDEEGEGGALTKPLLITSLTPPPPPTTTATTTTATTTTTTTTTAVASKSINRHRLMPHHNRWTYMVPPCYHLAHTQCLQQWLLIKSECPVCRRPLPPT